MFTERSVKTIQILRHRVLNGLQRTLLFCSCMIRLLSRIPHYPVSKLSLLVFLCVAGRAFWRERGKGVGEQPNYTTTRKPGPL